MGTEPMSFAPSEPPQPPASSQSAPSLSEGSSFPSSDPSAFPSSDSSSDRQDDNDHGDGTAADSSADLSWAAVIRPDIDPDVLASDAADAERRKHRRRMSREHIRRIKRKKRIRNILLAIVALIVALIGIAGWFAVSALKAFSEVEAAVSSASQIQTQVMAGETDAAKASINDFADHIDATYHETSNLAWTVASITPYYGSDIRAVRDTVAILEDVSNNALPKLANSVSGLNLRTIGIKNGTIDLGDMASIADDLTAANSVIADANVNLGKIDGTHVQQLTDALATAKTKFGQLSGLVDLGTRVANLAPSMFDLTDQGNGKARTYLVLVQNNAELRTTGGIPGSWGTLTVNEGKLSIGEFEPADPNAIVSQPIITLTADEKSLFSEKLGTFQQDINFTPDFPRTAQLASAMWKHLHNQDVDGVISIDPVFLQNLIKATGSMTLPDGTVLNGDNTAQILLNQTYIDKPSGDEQDEFFSATASNVFNYVLTSAGNNGTGLVGAVKQSVLDRHVYLWSAHDDEQKRIQDTTIAGALQSNPSKPVAGVYFNDNTMGKMDWYLTREITSKYDKTYPTGAKQYTIHVKLTNTADPAKVGTYPDAILGHDQHDVTRSGEISTIAYVYAPAGGRLVDWKFTGSGAGNGQFDSIGVHDGLTLGAKSIVLQPGESIELTVHVATSPVGGDTAMILRTTPDSRE
ncbi:late cornified envelope protein 3C [Bifidobacterium ramosum]|uniref:Late cornified envelope protein 3C n=3 Tax=Bifidobacterium ramosum TaxID=1798158 RepID=A0A6L4X0F3_9BIFI|nr:late cornified envelope protein 3C [Bifidobacterium ramosum]